MNVEQAKAKLEELLAEKKQLEQVIEEAKKAEVRLRDLNFLWVGDIRLAELAVRDAQFPVYEIERPGTRWEATIRVVGVNGRWIQLRKDKRCKIEFFDKYTGRPKGARDDSRNIDAAKALALWEQHLEEQK